MHPHVDSATDLPLARQLARSALAVDAADLTAEVRAKAKLCLLDFLSCAFEAHDLPWSQQALAITRHADSGASIIGTEVMAHPHDAAFVNATLGHGLVREDMHAASISHHGVVVWPTLLALAQSGTFSGQRFLTAAVLGYEAGARLGRALFNSDLARLFRPTGLVAPIGAALAGGFLLGLGEDELTHAISLAANTASGLNQWPHSGGSEMYFHPGFAARNALTAVALAGSGAYASEDILEGEAGLFAAFRRQPAQVPVALFADGQAEILAVYNKPVPACNFAQASCQAALVLARKIGEQRRNIRSVVIRVPEAAARYPGCDYKGPFERPLQAKMSIQYGAAAALARGVIEESNYQILDDADVSRLVACAKLETDPAFTAAFPRAQGAEIAVTLDDGTQYVHRLDDVVPATSDEIRVRFRRSAAASIGNQRAEDIEAAVNALESCADAGQIALLAGQTANKAGRRERIPMEAASS